MNLRQEIFRFIGASVINIPLAALLMWGLLASMRKSKLSRVAKILVAYLIIALGLAAFSFGRTGVITEFVVYQQLAVIIWTLGVLIFWRPKPVA